MGELIEEKGCMYNDWWIDDEMEVFPGWWVEDEMCRKLDFGKEGTEVCVALHHLRNHCQ